MEIKKKYLKRTGWLRILESRFAFCPCSGGVCSLMELTKVKEPLIAEFKGETLKIVDDGYFWLQVAPENESFWITAMFDGGGNILQYYFDITDENVICGEDSHFYDLFLDLVAMPDGRLITLDEDELSEALSEGVITEGQYQKALSVHDKLKKEIPSRAAELEAFCIKMLLKLQKMI